jgi:phenylacetate-CoA ligase
MNNDVVLKFKDLLSFVFNNEHSSFYRDKYQKAGFMPNADFQSLEDIKRIPLLTRKELAEEDCSRLLFVPDQEAEIVSPTSGSTTGKPFITFHSIKDRLVPHPDIEMPQNKALVLMSPFRAPITSLAVKQAKAKHVLMGDIFNLPASCYLASKLGVNHISTTPALLLILKKYLVNYPDLEKNLRSFVIGGELVTPEKKKMLQELYPDKEIFMIYGLSEAGGINARQCRTLAGRSREVLFHPGVETCYFEIINPETEKEVPFGERGELIITNFKNRATPLIRYRTGDSASFKENDCPCGAPGPLLEFYGRINYDIIKVGGIELRSDMLEKPLMNLSSYLKDCFEVHVHEAFAGNKPKIQITLNLSLKEGVGDSPAIRKKIEEEFLENWRLSPRFNLRKAVETGLFGFPQINFVQFPLTGKARRVLILN